MMRPSPFNAFILAAGYGTRMMPYTKDMPKPMMRVGGVPLIDHTLAHLRAAGVKKVAINLHYKGAVLKGHLAGCKDPALMFSEEPYVLETGLGIKRALHLMEEKPFFAINGDALWTDGPINPALQRLEEAFDPETMDILLLLQPLDKMVLTKGTGDYHLQPDGRIVRAKAQEGAYAFTGVRITKPEVFKDTPDEPFSFLACMDAAEKQGRLFGLVHDGEWHHLSTPEDLDRVNAAWGD